MKTILGTGQLGLAVMDSLLKDNPTELLLLVNRTGKIGITLPDTVQLIAADVTNKVDMEAIARKSDVIFSCTDVPYQLWPDFYPATASALAYALDKSSAKLVFADNLYSYGNVSGAIMHEEMPHKAQTKKGILRTLVIETLLTSGTSVSSRVAFVKAADFIGPRIHKGVFGTDFLERLYTGKTILLFGKIALPHTFTYIDDFARAMVYVGSTPAAFGQLWHVPNAPAMNLSAWIRLFEAETNKKAKVMVLPKSIVWVAGLFNTLIKELYELAYQFDYPYLVNHDKYVTHFGNTATDPSAIVAETIYWYKSTNKL